MQILNPVVAQVSPNIYAAAQQAGLDSTGLNQVEQMSFAIKKHRELNKLKPDLARSEFDKLDSRIKEGMKFLFKDSSYLEPPADAGDKVWGAVKSVGKALASPLIALFSVAHSYNRVINSPYLAMRESQETGQAFFSKKVWSAAWDGKEIYDTQALKEATSMFGKEDIAVARGLLAGKTPGEIIQEYGKVDNKILASITKAFDKPDDFRQILDGVKYAQVSPGRDIARMMDDKPPASGGLHGNYIDGTTKNVSGVLDFVYQLVIDPLTWLTGGGSKAFTVGERLSKTITEAANAGDLAGGVAKVMQNRRVNQLWENELGPAIKNYSDATTTAEKTVAYDEIARQFPGYRNREVIDTLSRGKVHDAGSAKNFFEQAQNVHLMLSGRVDGVTYYRNGVAVAKRSRNMSDGMIVALDSIFNPTTSRTVGRLNIKGRSIVELEKQGNDVHDVLLKAGQSLDDLASNQTILTAQKEIKGLKKLGKLAARSPAGLEIKIGENAIQTAQNFNTVARQLLPRDLANFLTTKFIESKADEQAVIVRNLYASIMLKHGLNGHPDGEKLIETVLRDKFGDKVGFTTVSKTGINPDHVKFMDPNSIKLENNVPTLVNDHPIQTWQSTQAIGSLPYEDIAKIAYQIKSKKNIINAMGGATSSDFSRKIVDAWSILTLFPRLGIRSAIDEGLMFILTAPGKDLLDYALRKGNRLGKVSTAFTGSKESTGPIKALLGKMLSNNTYDAISPVQREQIVNKLAKDLGVNPAELSNIQKRLAIGKHAEELFGKMLDDESTGYLLQALVHQPDMLTSIAQSLVARSGLSGDFGPDILASIITPGNLDKALADLGLKMSPGTQTISSTRLNDMQLSVAHFERFIKTFGADIKKFGNGIYDPAAVFLRNNALEPGKLASPSIFGQPEEWFQRAMNELANSVGVRWNGRLNKYVVQDQKSVDAFKLMSARSQQLAQDGADDVTIVRDQIGRVLVDMYNTFHGGANNYNKTLMDIVKANHSAITATSNNVEAPWVKAISNISIDDFRTATINHRISGDISTNIDFDILTDFPSVWKKYGNKMMEAMDRQVNAIFRQPALLVTYTSLRKKYAGIEKQYHKDYAAELTAKNATLKKSLQKSVSEIEEAAKSFTEKRFTEILTREAADHVLKYADNPAIRSNFAFNSRTLGRYYRATEDFQRRIFRMKEVPLRVLYRMRLAHLGLDASGSVYEDMNGEKYVLMPTDNIIFKATDATIRVLTGNSGYSQPMFNDFTFKLRMVNPSFSQDSGLPTLSGPIAGLGVVTIQSILGNVNKIPLFGGLLDQPGKKAAQAVDSFALGSIGDNINVTKAIVPASLQKLWAIIDPTEKSRQEVTAAQQAMAYNAAHGTFLKADASEEDKAKYLKNIRISAHNILALRNFLGLISPVAPSMQEGVDLPGYLRKVGITGLRPEFFDILQGIAKNNAKYGDVQDPYELALATFIGKNPNKLVYTVARTDKQTRVVVQNTTELQNWAIENKSLINTYGEAAYIFAPHVGKFNASSYAWLEAAGLVKSVSLENYYTSLLVVQDKQSYYNVARLEKEALSNTSDPELRSQIIKDSTATRDNLKVSNPLLAKALIGDGNQIGSESKLLTSVEQIVSDPNTSIDPGTRQRMNLAIKIIRDFMLFASDPSMKNVVNFADLKRNRKAQVEANLRDLMMGDLYVTEANRAIFSSILDFYSRDSYVAFKKGS